MNVKKSILLLWLLAGISSGRAQPFQNLGFDGAITNNIFSVNPPLDLDVYGPTPELLRGWQLLKGSSAESLMGFNLLPLGLGVSSLYSPAIIQQMAAVPVFGLYSVGFYPGYDAQSGAYVPFSLFQQGAIPASAQFIHFTSFGSPMELRVNGSLVPLTYDYLPGFTNLDTRIGDAVGDISPYAGQNVELRFTTVDLADSSLNGLDGIYFDAVPEPAPLALAALGVGLLAIHNARRVQKRGGSGSKENTDSGRRP